MYAYNLKLTRHLFLSKRFQRFSSDLATTYQPHLVEAPWQQKQTAPPVLRLAEKTRGTFRMLLPPPNVTGQLHLGHALNATIQDVISRQRQQSGFDVQWIPGTDHAGIATQVVVEKQLMQQTGQTRHDLGREAFLQQVWQWKQEKGNSIKDSLKMLGCQLNWDKEYFTMDAQQSHAVAVAFTQLFDRQLIKRKRALVNWSCALQSAISDIEVDTLNISGPTDLNLPGYAQTVRFGLLYDIKYKLLHADEHIVVSTTRPETMLGDVAVAVHPADERYAKFREASEVQLLHPFRKQPIPLVFDVAVEREFGSGAVKLTPAHDRLDFEIAQRHLLPAVDVITAQGLIAEQFTSFAGLPRFAARLKVLEALQNMQLLGDVRAHQMSLPVCTRSGDIIEYLQLEQWFVDCQQMAEAAAAEVRSGRLQLLPAHFELEWQRWLHDCHDWCISRQLWWGHQIPAYLAKDAAGNECWVAAASEQQAREKAQQKLQAEPVSLERDADVLDTWFSSGILPFSVSGWPKAQYLDNYPLDLIQTGHDILFFWVARMVMLGLELTERAPFRKVLLNGIVCDALGRKMSKSLGNVITPQQVVEGCSLEHMLAELQRNGAAGLLSEAEVRKSCNGLKQLLPEGIPACGTDALRLTLCSYNTKNHFINFNVEECHMNKLFFNKIWQATRYTLSAAKKLHMELKTVESLDYVPLKQFDAWIVSRLAATLEICEEAHDNFNLHTAAIAIKNFFYTNFCDVYLETTKANINSGEHCGFVHVATLVTCLNLGLQALSPFAPHVAYELMQHLPKDIDLNLAQYRDEDLEKDIGDVLNICQHIRQLKSRNKISKRHEPLVLLQPQTTEAHSLLDQYVDEIQALTLCQKVELLNVDQPLPISEQPAELSSTAGALCTFAIKTNTAYLEERADLLNEVRQQNAKKLKKLESELASCRQRVDNEGFRKSASQAVQQKQLEKIQQLEVEIANIKALVN